MFIRTKGNIIEQVSREPTVHANTWTNLTTVAGMTLLAFVCLGCGAKIPTDIAPVEGTVTMDGKPLPYASVLFINGSSRPSGGSTDEEGRYFLTFTHGRRGAPIGKNLVRISTIRDPGETVDGKRFPGSDETVPAKYNAMTTLTFVVEPGKTNIANFELDSNGPLPQELGEDEEVLQDVEADSPEGESPGAEAPESESPEAKSPEAASPEGESPGAASPEAATP